MFVLFMFAYCVLHLVVTTELVRIRSVVADAVNSLAALQISDLKLATVIGTPF